MFTDDSITLDRFLEARDESFETYPEYRWISQESYSG